MWIKAGNGNVFEIDDVEHALKIIKDTPLDGENKPVNTVWESDPRDKGAKAWKQPDPSSDESE